MKTEPSVKLIKKERKAPEPQAQAKSAAGPNRWSKAVQSWLGNFINISIPSPTPITQATFTFRVFAALASEVKPDGLDESAQWGLAAIHWVRSVTSSV